MQQSDGKGGARGRVLWIGLALTYLVMLRASESFAEKDGIIHKVYAWTGEAYGRKDRSAHERVEGGIKGGKEW